MVLIIVIDITKLRKFEKHKALERFKNIYFTSIAHDLKTPINTIMCTSESLSNKFKQDESILRLLKINTFSCVFLL